MGKVPSALPLALIAVLSGCQAEEDFDARYNKTRAGIEQQQDALQAKLEKAMVEKSDANADRVTQPAEPARTDKGADAR